MVGKLEIGAVEEAWTPAKAADDVNRTVVMEGEPGALKRLSRAHLPKGGKCSHRKQELEEIIQGVNISPFISSELDTSAGLAAPLNELDMEYALLKEFAQGGTSRVSIARDRNLGRLVAVKSLKNEDDRDGHLFTSFVTEAKVTAQLDHPGIIPIYGLSRGDGKEIHLIMKLVNGKTLREYLRNTTLNYRMRGIEVFDEGMMLRRRLEIFLRVCDTISYAHHRNVIHRDLKPENIMIGKYMEVYVMDWGLAKILSEEGETKRPASPERLTGTPRYFPPEVLAGEPSDPRSDIFTLGLILQEIVTLQYAVVGKDAHEHMKHIADGDIAPVEHLFHWKIDKALKAVIKKATAYWPDERYQTVDDLAEDLRRYMAGLSVAAAPDSLWSIFTRWLFG